MKQKDVYYGVITERETDLIYKMKMYQMSCCKLFPVNIAYVTIWCGKSINLDLIVNKTKSLVLKK